MLNRVCTGRLSPRLRYRMMHQKIRPQTKNPTTSAAIVDAIHRSYILWACRLMPCSGQPNPPKALPTLSTEQPDSRASSLAPPTPSPASRTTRGRATELLETTCSCLPRAPPGAKSGHRRQGVTDGRTLLDLALPPADRGSDLRRTRETTDHVDDTVRKVEFMADPAGAPAYLDAASAAPPHPVARQALLAALADGWADPDRLYAAGRRAQQLREA